MSPESESRKQRPRALRLAMSPGGRAYLEPGDPERDALSPRTASRLEKAFAPGSGHGLLHLGAAESAADLPASLDFGRAFGRLFMERLCAVPDLPSRAGTLELPTPVDELASLATSMPPMTGGEYCTAELLGGLWAELGKAFRERIAESDGDVSAWLTRQDRVWNLVGRVCLHLAENKNSPQAPFAFLATYAAGVSSRARVQHLPLARALKEYAGASDRQALLNLLLPVQRAAAESALIKELLDSRAIYRPLAWTPQQAHRFLEEVPLLESCGLAVRLPDWWNPQRPRRPQVQVTVGAAPAAGLGLDAMLDFSVRLTLGDETLSEEEWRQALAGAGGLVQIRGQWVEVDREQLEQALKHWQQLERTAGKDGLSFVEGMRLLAGGALPSAAAGAADEATPDWSVVRAGDWLQEALAGLRDRQGLDAADPGEALRAELRPYQQEGLHWLWLLQRLGLGGCLADDMGLGKTVQVIALFLLLKRRADAGTHLVVAPASVVANWQAELKRFAPGLKVLVAHSAAMPAAELKKLSARRVARHDVVLTSYASMQRLAWVAKFPWHLVVLDEAQAIKNPGTKQTRAAKKLSSRSRLLLTGTPLENRLSDLWSLFDFACPGLLGSAHQFGRYSKALARQGSGAYRPLRELVRPYILRRLKSDRRIIADLPDKTEVAAYCGLARDQAALYQQSVDELTRQLEEGLQGMERRGLVLSYLLRFKQICNHPSQWLGDGEFAPAHSGKFGRLRELCEPIAERQERVLVFTQFRQMIDPLAEYLAVVFRRPGLVLHGGTPVRKRKQLVDRFQGEDGPPFFMISLKAGGTGLNLTAASHVIHFDRWWNPAVEDQATDRAYRIGQRRNVLVHKFVCRGTVEERIDEMIASKRELSEEILTGGGEAVLTELPDDELLELVSLDLGSALVE